VAHQTVGLGGKFPRDLAPPTWKEHDGGGGATRSLTKDGGAENSTETQQLGHAPRSGLEVKNGSSAKDGTLEKFRSEAIQKEVS